MSENQKAVLRYLGTVESATKDEIADGAGLRYFRNTRKYVGEILARMIKNNMIVRVKRGVYKIAPSKIENEKYELKIKLFQDL